MIITTERKLTRTELNKEGTKYQSSNQKMDQSKYITCKGCGLKREYILMHFAKDRSKDCKNSYTKEELSFLKKESKRRSDEKSKEKKKT